MLLLGYLFYNRKSNSTIEEVNEKPEISLTIKTPVLQMTSYKDKEINDTYTFMKKIATAFEEQYKDENVKVNVVQFEKADEDEQIIGCFDTEKATDILYEEYFNMSTYVHTGKVVPLDNIISEEIKNDINKLVLKNM